VKVKVDLTRKPRYWVEHNGKVLFKNGDFSKVLQWALDHADGKVIRIEGTEKTTRPPFAFKVSWGQENKPDES